MTEPALTPNLALDYLDELSTDIRAAVVLDSGGGLAAASSRADGDGARMAELTAELFERAEAAAGDSGAVAQIEAAAGGGIVFAVRDARWTIAVVTGAHALSSLMFYDLRAVLGDLTGGGG